MDRVESLKEAARGASVKFLEFMRASSKKPDMIICIFEGEDEKYYSQRLSYGLRPYEWQGLNAGNKKNVVSLFELVAAHPIYKNSRYLCFVDKDFETWWKNPSPEKIYQTPCYSIENLYVSERVFKRILSSEFQITEFNDGADDFDKCIRLFRGLRDEFYKIAFPFNLMLKTFRIMGRDGKLTFKINVRNLKLKLASITFEQVNAEYDLEQPLELFKEASGVWVCPDAYAEAGSSLSSSEGENSFRGKQNAEFFRQLICLLKEDRVSEMPSFFSQKRPVKLNISRENFISDISQYAETPDCLMSFLANFKDCLAARV